MPSATTAGVGTPSSVPMPVDVVDDPGADGVEIAGLVFAILAFVVGALASAFSIVLAQRAVRIGEKANAAAIKAAEEAERANQEASKARAAVAIERRRAFELELLRDLLVMLDADSNFVRGLVTVEGAGLDSVTGRMALLGDRELPRWKAALLAPTHRSFAAIFDLPYEQAFVMEEEADDMRPRLQVSPSLITAVRRAFHEDVLAAIECRMDARDD